MDNLRNFDYRMSQGEDYVWSNLTQMTNYVLCDKIDFCMKIVFTL